MKILRSSRRVALLALLGGVSFGAMPAFGQEDQSQAEAKAGGLSEIVVTAQRREERLQDVPVAITAADAEALAMARIENISNITNISPSIQFRSSNISSSSANVVIRGLGTTGNSRTFEGAVGIFIDGVYRTRAASALQNFLDIEAVQVLRGPQGTLFGKNTSAGAVLVNSTTPDVMDLGGNIELGYGNYNALDIKGAINIPFSEVAALRVAALYTEDDGHLSDPNSGKHYNSIDAQAYKAQLLIDPSSDFTMRVIADYSKSTGNCCYGTSDFINGPTQPLVDALTIARGSVLPSRRLKDREQVLTSPSRQKIIDYGATLLADFALGAGTLKSVTSLREFELVQLDVDSDFTGADIFSLDESFKSQFFSQELTYNGRLDALNSDFVVGGFYSKEQLDMTRDLYWNSQGQAYIDAIVSVAVPGAPPGTAFAAPGKWAGEDMAGTSTSYAAFAHINAEISDQFNIIAGLRYSIEKKKGSFRNSFYRSQPNDAFRLLGIQPGAPYAASTTDRALSGTLGVQYKPTSDAMVYFTYNRGFKAGGVNIDANGAGVRANNPAEVPGAVPLDPRFDPETVDAFEIGGKIDYMNRRARTNIALFYNKISDLQVAQFVGLQFTVLNAKSAELYGAEIENLFEITPSLTLGLDGIWLPHAKYGTDPALAAALSGQRFRYASKLSGNASLNLDQPINDDINLTGRVQYQYSSSQFINTASSTKRGGVGIMNGNIGIKSVDSGWQLEGWIQNMFNKTYTNLSFNTPIQAGDENAYLAPPRTYGITLRGSF
ncbi:TonB-dependent receptor [Parasphingorhabdus sp. JC815]|uniref:TonB-dependent receptor n=1 Tax=Parasphingorhabdus sp. JC815 TaxID=3232140 RepID=UPI00345A6346